MPEPSSTPTPPSTGTPPGIEVDLVPPAARENAARADQLQKDFIASQRGAPPPAPIAPVIPPAAPPVAPGSPPVVVAAPAPVVGTPPAVATPPAPGGEPPPPPPEATQEEIDLALAEHAEPGSPMAKWQQAYRSMRGRWDADRARDAATISELAALVDNRQPSPGAGAAFTAPVVPDDEPLITDEERANFGDDLTEVVERIATRAATRASKTIVGELVPSLNTMDQQARNDRQARMETGIAQAMAPTGLTFEQVNTHPDFLVWLKLRDPMSGAKRHDLLRDAWNSQDGSRVLAIVAGFLDTISLPPSPQPNGATPPAGNPPAPRVPQIPIAELAAPGRVTHPSAAPAPAEEKPIYTRQEIKDFYAAKARGYYTPEDATKWENEIFAATREGRIRG